MSDRERANEARSGLLALIRESGGDFGMAKGLRDDDSVADVQIAAIGPAAASLVAVVEAWHERWVAISENHALLAGCPPPESSR